jgi:hypothetical protein
MAALSWDEIVERGKQHNKTVICEVDRKGKKRCFDVICKVCNNRYSLVIHNFDNCKICGYERLRGNTENFILRATEIHGDKYNYDLVEYISIKLKVKILCNNCHNIFEKRPDRILAGQGCKICLDNSKRSSNEIFIRRSIEIHGDKYNYDLVEYSQAHKHVKIICNRCKRIFLQAPNHHHRGRGCKNCNYSFDDFLISAKKIHNDKYNYDLVEYKKSIYKIKILCNKCNNYFFQTPAKHLQGRGCPKCNESKGENRVAQYLTSNKFRYTKNKIFKTLKHKSYLKPDFYLDDDNLLIEYDGHGHHMPCFGSTQEDKQKNLEDCQRRDKIKNEWAKANNIPLLRIPYWDFDRIEELIEAFIIQHTKKKEIKQLVLEM